MKLPKPVEIDIEYDMRTRKIALQLNEVTNAVNQIIKYLEKDKSE